MAKRVLFVDDDALVARIYGEKLREDGFDVVVAEDGVIAMKRLIEFRPDVVVLDLLMPRMNGADVLKFIRERPELKNTRVIVFSNSFLAALVEEIGTLGFEEILPKSSATPARLIELISRDPVVTTPTAAMPRAGKSAARQNEPPAETKLSIISEPSPARIAAKKNDEFRARVHQEFVKNLPKVVADIRQLSRNLLNATDAKVEIQLIEDLSRKVGFLTQMAGMANCAELAQLSSALELLFFHLHEKRAPVADSCRNTIAATVAFLTQHLEQFDPALAENPPPATVLLVDDDQVSNRSIVHALIHANVRATSVTNPEEALQKLLQTPYNLILLDIQLPGMDGIELCEKIRVIDLHRRTPVIFITGHSDLKTRARSILSGGNDFISKPILPIELTVKVITQLLKSRVNSSA